MAELTLPDGRRAVAPDVEDALAVYREIFDSDDYAAVADIGHETTLIVDIGANIGLFSLYAKLARPRAAVHAFEPVPEIFAALEDNIRTWALPDVSVHRLAVGHQVGEVVCTYFPHQPADSTIYPADKQIQREYLDNRAQPAPVERLFHSRPVAVPMTTLDELARTLLPPGRIDLLKIDVEGAELDVLHGMGPRLWERVDRIVLEVQDTRDRLADICTLLTARHCAFRVTAASQLPHEYGLSMVTATAAGVRTASATGAASRH